jgi:glycogen operon protein
MLLGGDEIGRTQSGNNNAYCQDSELSWFDWEAADEHLLAFTQRLVQIRRQHPVFRRRDFFQGRILIGEGTHDIAWFRPDGREMGQDDWEAPVGQSLVVYLNGEAIPSPDMRGERVVDDSFLLLFNNGGEPVKATVPTGWWGQQWSLVFDTAAPDDGEGARTYKSGDQVPLEARSVVLLVRDA